MVDTKTPGDKTLSMPSKTLTLKPRVETGTVRQSFSHGRSKQVVVEKRGKRRVPGEAAPAEGPAPEPVAKATPAKPAPGGRPGAPAAPRSGSGVVLRTLTEDERSARASREGIEQAEREAAEARRKAEDERHRHEEEAKRKAEQEAKRRFGEAEAAAAAKPAPATAKPATTTARTPAAVKAPGVAVEAEEEEAP